VTANRAAWIVRFIVAPREGVLSPWQSRPDKICPNRRVAYPGQRYRPGRVGMNRWDTWRGYPVQPWIRRCGRDGNSIPC